MVFLSVLSFIASIIYFYTGYHALMSNRMSRLCRLYFLINMSMMIWSFAGGYLYLAEDIYEYSFWNKVAAFGWCTFEALVLYFALVLVDHKYIKKRFVRIILFLPAFIFLFMVLFLFWPGISVPPILNTVFYTGNFLYNFIYLSVSIRLIFIWGHRSDNKLQKRQADIIVACSTIAFLLNFFFQWLLPFLGGIRLPFMGQILTLIMLMGVNYSIIRYQFLFVSDSVIMRNLFDEMTGMTIVTDPKGQIIKVNRSVCSLLDFTQEELLGRHITAIIKDMEHLLNPEEWETAHELIRFQDINVINKSGNHIPFNLSVIPLYIISDILLGLLIVGEDIRANKSLQKANDDLVLLNSILAHKAVTDGLTNLYNHQSTNEILDREILKINETHGKLCIMMLDIDDFKKVNDYYGHQVGDKVLVSIAGLIQNNTRECDYIGRYGGEEFIVILPDTDLEETYVIAEAIRSGVRNNVNFPGDLTVTVSIGVAQYTGEKPSALINKADKLLYKAKYSGKNRVEK